MDGVFLTNQTFYLFPVEKKHRWQEINQYVQILNEEKNIYYYNGEYYFYFGFGKCFVNLHTRFYIM